MSKQDIRFWLSLDRELTHMKQDAGFKVKHHLSQDDIHHLRESMRNLGAFHDDFGYNKPFDLVRAEFDDELWKCFIPEHLTDEEQREIEDGMWVHAVPSQYDCTGQRFTHWISFYEVPAGTWIYHSLGYDY